MVQPDCVFCRIVAGQAAASYVHEGERVIAFMDIQPINPGHLLVVPREHKESLAEMGQDEIAECFRIAQRLGAALRASGVACEGVNLFVADGEAAFQDVFHFHVHVIPRFFGDGFSLSFPPGYEALPERPVLDRVAEQVRNGLASLPG